MKQIPVADAPGHRMGAVTRWVSGLDPAQQMTVAGGSGPVSGGDAGA